MSILHQVAVIGGGRWARTLTEALCGIVQPSIPISIHSSHCLDAVMAWIETKQLGKRVHASPECPALSQPVSSAVIVANAARDHEQAAERALRSGASVLVEKPLALTATGARRLEELARNTNGRLAAANVFLFCRYIESLARSLAKDDELRSIRLRWIDPANESRYGQIKKYDPGLPVFADVLPHVSAILGALIGDAPQECVHVELLRGGAQVELQLTSGGIPCHVILARNGRRRERSIRVGLNRVGLNRSTVLLDFAVEPGTLMENGVTRNADPDWNTKSRPLELMLRAFLRWISTEEFDGRLGLAPALRACALIEQVSPMYNDALGSWLTSRLSVPDDGEDLRYALNEILQSSGPLSSGTVEAEMDRLRRFHATAPNSNWIARVVTAPDRREALRALQRT